MFTFVLKKFFTERFKFENKEATPQPARCLTRNKRTPAMTELRETLARASGTLAQDFAGAAALAVIVLVALTLPGVY